MWGVSRWQQFQHSTIWFRIYDSHRTAFNLFTIRQSAVLASGASWLPNRDLERCDKWSYYHAVGASSIAPQLYVCSRPLVSGAPQQRFRARCNKDHFLKQLMDGQSSRHEDKTYCTGKWIQGQRRGQTNFMSKRHRHRWHSLLVQSTTLTFWRRITVSAPANMFKTQCPCTSVTYA